MICFRYWKLLEQCDQRESEFPLLQIGSQGFARHAFVADQIEQIIGDLEGDAQMPAVSCQTPNNIGFCTGVECPEPATALRQGSGLSFDDRKVILLVKIEVAACSLICRSSPAQTRLVASPIH